jgi:hypothetical protein
MVASSPQVPTARFSSGPNDCGEHIAPTILEVRPHFLAISAGHWNLQGNVWLKRRGAQEVSRRSRRPFSAITARLCSARSGFENPSFEGLFVDSTVSVERP